MNTSSGTKGCASCGRPRGNQRAAWVPITNGEAVTGFTCPDCPTASEPIRRIESRPGRPAFRARVDSTRYEPGRPRKQVSATFDTLVAARGWVTEVRASVRSGGAYGDAAREAAETVEHLCSRWLETRIDVRRVTREGYRQSLAAVMRHPIAQQPVTSVTIADAQALVGWLAREGMRPKKGREVGTPLSPNSIRSVKIALQQALDMAVAEGLIERNVVKLARWPKLTSVGGNDLEHWPIVGTGDRARCPAIETFREHADEDSLGGAWRLTLTGATRSEVCGLRWADVDLVAGVATITQARVALEDGSTEVNEPKSPQRFRAIPFEQIHPGTTALLKRLRAKQAADRLAAGAAWRDSGFVVVDEVGDPIRPEVYSDRFRRLCAAAGVPTIRLHNVRHTIALLLKLRGEPPWVGAGLLGHSVEVHEKTYARGYAAPGMNAAASSLGSAFGRRSASSVAAEV